MISNERQYGITKSEAAKFEAALAGLETAEGHRPDEMRQIMREAMYQRCPLPTRRALHHDDAFAAAAVGIDSVSEGVASANTIPRHADTPSW